MIHKRLRHVEHKQHRQEQQLADHERLLGDMKTHLEALIERLYSVEKKVTVIGVLLVIGSPLATHLLGIVAG
jgi:hypothetical protein